MLSPDSQFDVMFAWFCFWWCFFLLYFLWWWFFFLHFLWVMLFPLCECLGLLCLFSLISIVTVLYQFYISTKCDTNRDLSPFQVCRVKCWVGNWVCKQSQWIPGQLDRPHKRGGQGWYKKNVKKEKKLFVEVAKSGQIMFIPDHIPVFMEIAQPSFPYHIKKYKILD